MTKRGSNGGKRPGKEVTEIRRLEKIAMGVEALGGGSNRSRKIGKSSNKRRIIREASNRDKKTRIRGSSNGSRMAEGKKTRGSSNRN